MHEALNRRLAFIVEEHIEQTRRLLGGLVAKLAQNGNLHSSGAQIAIANLAQEALDGVLVDLVSAGQVAIQQRISRSEATEILRAAGAGLAQSLRGILQAGAAGLAVGQYGAKPEVLDRLAARLDNQLIQFGDGYLEAKLAQDTGNVVIVNGGTGTAIQQGNVNSAQHVAITIDYAEAKSSLESLATELANENLAGDVLADIQADMNTLRAQLARPTPSPTLVREVGRSLRTFVEAVVANAAAPALITAAQTLWVSLAIN